MKTLSDRKRIHYKRILFKEIPTVISLHPPVANLLVLFGDTTYIVTHCVQIIFHISAKFSQNIPSKTVTTADSHASLTAISRIFKQIFWKMLLKCKI